MKTKLIFFSFPNFKCVMPFIASWLANTSWYYFAHHCYPTIPQTVSSHHIAVLQCTISLCASPQQKKMESRLQGQDLHQCPASSRGWTGYAPDISCNPPQAAWPQPQLIQHGTERLQGHLARAAAARLARKAAQCHRLSLIPVNKLHWVALMQKLHFIQWLNVHRCVAVSDLRHGSAK